MTVTKGIRVLILDIDGTIAGRSNQVSQAVRQAIKQAQAKGIMVGLATGRMFCSAKAFHEAIGADLPIIAYNGAWVQRADTGEMLLHQPVHKNIAQELVQYFRQQQQENELDIHLYYDDQLYVENFNEKTDFYVQRSGIDYNLVERLEDLLDNHPTKILAQSPDSDLITYLLEDLQRRYPPEKVFLTQSNPVYLEATRANVNKGSAVKYLVEKILDLKPENVMAIGDNLNDYTMLKYAGFSVAMGDAPAEVKAIASAVTDDVENDGVAKAIQEYLL
ncbi:MAG: Cof-type HAD-IIB family hydrolase [Geminocystis sp.]|nr:Cof-type HAD-IIB family hydrolase [Geminocystis sp.]